MNDASHGGPDSGLFILVTGAARGIGRELVRQYLAEGATVLALDRDPITGDTSRGTLIPVRCDVADPRSVLDAAAFAATRIPHLDILINNAGVVGKRDHFEDFAAEDFLRVLQINTAGPLIVTRAFFDLLRKAPSPRVLSLTSRTGTLFGFDAGPGAGYGYCSSKAALQRLLPLLAGDLRPAGVICVGISPGFVETDVTRGYAAGRFQLQPEEAVRGIRNVAAQLTPAHSGHLLRWDGKICRWLAAQETAEDLQRTKPALPEPFILESPANPDPEDAHT